MFSWKKQNPPSQQRQQQQAVGGHGDYSDLIAQGMRLANEDHDHGIGEDMDDDDDDGDLGDIDLNDPDLLAELQGLTGEAPAPKPKPAPTQASPKTSTIAPAPVAALAQQQRPAVAAKQPSTNTSAQPQASKKSSPSSPAADTPASLAALGVDLHGVMEDNDEDVELTEDDWNDPHLLAQLQSYGGHVEHHDQKPGASARTAAGSTAKPAPASPPPATSTPIPTESGPLSSADAQPSSEKKPASTNSSIIAIPPKDKAFHDEDMDGDSIMAEQQQEEPKTSEQPTLSSPVKEKSPKRLEEISKKNDKDLLRLLQTRDKQYKRAALDAKRAGDMALAAERVKTFKTLQTWIRLVEAGGFLDLELYPIPDEPSTGTTTTKADEGASPAGTSASPAIPSTQQGAPQTPGSKSYTPPISSSAPNSTTQVSSSIAEASAEDMRSGSLVRGAAGGGIEFKRLAVDDDFQIVSNSDDDTYDMLQSQLESQIKMCTTICMYYYQIGDQKTAVEFNRVNKVFKADLVSLQSHRSHKMKAPAFHFQDVRFEVEVGFYQEIGLNDLALSIVRAWDLSHKDVQPKDIEAYVIWDLGWPTENMAGAGNGKGTTPTVKRSPKPDFNYNKTLGIERTKAFQRFAEKRKATFEVWHYRGLLWKDYLIGRAQVPLESLLNHSEIHEILPASTSSRQHEELFILLNPTTRRNTGGKIEIKIRLQRPLLEPEIVVKEEKWLVIDEFNSGGLGFPSPVAAAAPSRSVASPLARRAGTSAGRATKGAATPAAPASRTVPIPAPTAAPAPPTTPAAQPRQTAAPLKQPAATSSTPIAEPAARSSNPIPAVPKAATPAATAKPKMAAPAPEEPEESESDKALSELNSVDLLVSNMVLESEIQRAQQMVHDARAVGNKEAAEEHQDRLTQLEIKMKLLVLQVQTGQLTMDAYCQTVNARIEKDKKLAMEFKRLNMLPEAKRALTRYMIMAKEMKEVEEAMAAQGEGDEEEEV
ncbi:hypothetical protein BC939DRAFT_498827 [Gamsiella multidivaricata]|uniref:uncharacterized protein n=1 Tax=Gamsiella multidivaricata TaxID=101098 RepID=UPI0022210F13|nr:uncharacterized protein BC939DRAFT_498827 [Gamsiella multidivaricata]KAI7831377.1 hypothetical protein BC939DRAFT_498827 [Gamsiella multidivaricata]